MKKKHLVDLLAAIIPFFQIAYAAVPIDGWYGSFFGGYTYLPNNVNRTMDGLNWSKVRYINGWDVGGTLGFKNNPMRYEAEVTYLNATVTKFKLNQVAQNAAYGYSNGIIGMANVYYDLPGILCCIQPFIGGGIGYAWVHAFLNTEISSLPLRLNLQDSVFAYQGTTGLTYNFAEDWAMTIAYRYLGTSNAGALNSIFQTHMANMSVIYRFDGCHYK